MNLENHIEEIRSGLKAGRYPNEASVSQGIVLRLLQALGWPTYDTQVVRPEYSLEGRRVDFGLCHPTNKPVAFIEVKQIGQSNGAERQLFEYAFHVGVPLAILTDGQEWNFFLPAEQGDYGERRVYKLDIAERDSAECSARLCRYISYDEITSGRAIAAAREDYRSISRDRQMKATLPEAWFNLITEGDDLLLELLADRVASLCGFKPDLDQVAHFLKENVLLRSTTTHAQPLRSVPVAAPIKPFAKSSTPLRTIKTTGFSLGGRDFNARNAREVLINVFEALAERDQTFLERFAALPKHGRTRRYLARTPDELYPGRPDLAREHWSKLRAGWYLGTNVSRVTIERIIEMCCNVANLHFGHDLVINLGE